MFLFESKNEKLVKDWKKEHIKLVELGNLVLAEYVKGNYDQSKRYLKKFIDLAMHHLSSEDIEMFKMLHEEGEHDKHTEQMIDDFNRSFKDVKTTLMKFLAKYVKPEVALDDEFFDTFQQIMEILRKRIDYEENNLYFHLSLS